MGDIPSQGGAAWNFGTSWVVVQSVTLDRSGVTDVLLGGDDSLLLSISKFTPQVACDIDLPSPAMEPAMQASCQKLVDTMIASKVLNVFARDPFPLLGHRAFRTPRRMFSNDVSSQESIHRAIRDRLPKAID